MMIKKQPFLILGLNDYKESEDIASQCMWLFIAIFSTSLTFIFYESNTRPVYRHVQHAEDHPILPPGMTDYRVSTEVELSGMMIRSDLREIS